MGFNFTWNEIPQKFPRRQVCKILVLYCILLRPTNVACLTNEIITDVCTPGVTMEIPRVKNQTTELKEQLRKWKSSFVAIVNNLDNKYHSCKRFHTVELPVTSLALPFLSLACPLRIPCEASLGFIKGQVQTLYSSLASPFGIHYPSITCPLPDTYL